MLRGSKPLVPAISEQTGYPFTAMPGRLIQRADIAPPQAEGEELSGVTRDWELNAFISVPASFVGGVPLTRAMNPWAMPEAST